MTVTVSYSPLTYNCNGSTTAFSVTWPFFLSSDLVVTHITSGGVETALVLNTDYTVSGGRDTTTGLPAVGTVTTLSTYASGVKIRISRSTPKTQSTSFTTAGAFPAKTVEAMIDRVHMIAEEGAGGSPAQDVDGASLRLETSGATDYWDGEGYIARGFDTPTDDSDLATKGYVDSIVINNSLPTPLDIENGGTGLSDITSHAVMLGAGTEPVALAVPSTAGYALLSNGDSVDPSFSGFTQAGAGAVTRTWRDKARDHFDIRDFAAGTPVTAAELQAALDAVGAAGGSVYVPSSVTINISTQNVTIPANVALIGEKSPMGNITPSNMTSYGPRINISSSYKIILQNSSEVRNFAVFRSGLTFNITAAQVASTFTGTAFELADGVSDAAVTDCAILGFAYAVRSVSGATNVSRLRIARLNIDCLNGLFLENSFDVTYIDQVHCWPFVTVNSSSESNSAQLKRSGSAVCVSGTHDWTKITNCFSYGYARGFNANGGDSVTFIGCSTDYPNVAADGAIGFLIDGSAFEVRLIGCQSASTANCVYIDTTATNGVVTVDGFNAWEAKTNAIALVQGSAIITSSALRNTGGAGNGVVVQSTATEARIVNCQIKGFAVGIGSGASTVPVYQNGNDFAGTTTHVLTPYKPTIASASTITPDGEAVAFEITGTTTITTIDNMAAYAGRLVTFWFASTAGVTHNGTTINLARGQSFAGVAGGTLQLISDGTNWYEVARSPVFGDWTTYTPTITASSGSFTTVSATGRYRKRGTEVHYKITITVTTNGTAAGQVVATLPVSASGSHPRRTGVGREVAVTGVMLTATVETSGTTMQIVNYGNGYPASNGSVLEVEGSYEAAS